MPSPHTSKCTQPKQGTDFSIYPSKNSNFFAKEYSPSISKTSIFITKSFKTKTTSLFSRKFVLGSFNKYKQILFSSHFPYCSKNYFIIFLISPTNSISSFPFVYNCPPVTPLSTSNSLETYT